MSSVQTYNAESIVDEKKQEPQSTHSIKSYFCSFIEFWTSKYRRHNTGEVIGTITSIPCELFWPQPNSYQVHSFTTKISSILAIV